MNGIAVLAEINANCASVEQFMKRFFDNFNAFRVLKYLNFVHESCYSKIDILSAANKLLAELNLPVAESLECAFRFSESYSDRRGKRGEEKLELT